MRTILVAFCTIVLTIAAFSQDAKQKPDAKGNVVLKGIVVDAMCGKDMGGAEDGMAKAAKHKRSCALEDNCASSGYGLVSDNKWIKFDANGDKQAKALIEKTERKNDLTVEVTGKREGDTFAVASIKEAAASKETKAKAAKKTQKSGS